MDNRRLSTGDVLAAGVLNLPAPKTGVPEGREQFGVDVENVRTAAVREALERGAEIHCSEYYGIPILWKHDDGRFRGVLLQYRVVTEEHAWDSADEALDWLAETARAVAG